ncbi:MAG: hypothetical protein CVV64_13325 [Candidatus Wallbacteria bacterium HGW-Wallbacteria-1]|jgi:uncharacterized membrane protein|uniref:Histidine kinase n=1 Tax=Candidatus Wallbacteria bacterium HGW-Wallbacteria-1 TaxID=2013854 RepID=A0A2N1PMS1_9BACT|nr:MAG: hypothetical protein CVV64_13325 [Candidatus Wallbacteria bacterium HGW-Wallbacteria-1]
MAGIGFRLRRILDQDSYISTIKAYLFSALISSGTWLVTILVIGLLGAIQLRNIPFIQASTFRITIVYVYAFSLIIVGIFQMPLTRYLADLLYSRDTEMVFPTYTGSVTLIGFIQAALAFPFCFLASGWDIIYAGHAYILYMTVTVIWIALIFLSAARNYTSMVVSFIAGGAVSVVAGWYLGGRIGLSGYMAGYTIGHVVLALLLSGQIAVEFTSRSAISFEWVTYLRRFPSLMISGFTYNLAIWIDKFIFWFSPETGEWVQSFLHACPLYDVPAYYSYLSVVPAMSLFLIRVETSFMDNYREFYSAIVGKQGLGMIRRVKKEMVDNLHFSIGRLLKVQGLFTMLFIVAAPSLIKPLGMAWINLTVFRICTLGAFIHVLGLFVMIALLYFEFRTEAALLTCTFLILNALLTYLTLNLGVAWYGYGYFAAALITLAGGILMLDRKIRKLEYLTFVGQPVS